MNLSKRGIAYSFRKLLLSVIIFLPVISGGCVKGSVEKGEATETIEEDKGIGEAEAASDMTSLFEYLADSIMSGMTLEERVGQCLMPAVESEASEINLKRIKRYLSDYHVGGILLMKGDIESAKKISELCHESRVPLFISIDAEWGLGMRLTDAPVFPRNFDLGPNADETSMYEYGREVGRECKLIGINMILGPVVDVSATRRGVIGSRSFGGDSRRVADLGVAYSKGIESNGVISVAKHFPGHGSTRKDSHNTLPVIDKSLNMLDSIDLYPFTNYIESGLSGIMIGHLSIPAIDPEGLPSAVSPKVIRNLLREDMGFRGLVMTDAFDMAGADGYEPADALNAGADIVIAPLSVKDALNDVSQKIKEGEIDEETINAHCRNILFHKLMVSLPPNSVEKIENYSEDFNERAEMVRRLLAGQESIPLSL